MAWMPTGEAVWVRLPDDNVIFEEELKIYRQQIKRARTEEVLCAFEKFESCLVTSFLPLAQVVVEKLFDAGLRPSYPPSLFSNFAAIVALQVSYQGHFACFHC